MRVHRLTELRHAVAAILGLVSVLLPMAVDGLVLHAHSDQVHRIEVRSCEGGGIDLVLAHDEPEAAGAGDFETELGAQPKEGPLHADHVIRCAQDPSEAAVLADALQHAPVVQPTIVIPRHPGTPPLGGTPLDWAALPSAHISTTVLRF